MLNNKHLQPHFYLAHMSQSVIFIFSTSSQNVLAQFWSNLLCMTIMTIALIVVRIRWLGGYRCHSRGKVKLQKSSPKLQCLLCKILDTSWHALSTVYNTKLKGSFENMLCILRLRFKSVIYREYSYFRHLLKIFWPDFSTDFDPHHCKHCENFIKIWPVVSEYLAHVYPIWPPSLMDMSSSKYKLWSPLL